MTALATELRRPRRFVPPLLLVCAAYVLAADLAFDLGATAKSLAGVLCLSALVVAGPTIRWRWLLCVVLLVIMFVPIGEYFLPGNLPFQLEPYRVVVGIVLALWVASLLVDSSVRLHATGFEGPLACLLVVTLASVALNPGRVAPVQSDVVKSVVFFASFLLFYYLVGSTVRSWADIDLLIKLLVGTASILGLLALIEYRTGHSYFNELDKIVPLRRVPFDPQPRGFRIRAQGSAQHPIAFGALMIMLMPLCIYLVRKYGKRWYVAPFLLGLGALASVSRTAIVMLAAAAAAVVWIRPRAAFDFVRRPRTLLAFAVILVCIKILAPGAIGTLRYEFNPPGGIAADQSTSKGSAVSGGRLTDVGPVLNDIAHEPLLGIGYGTNVTGRTATGVGYNSGRILDDQWLGTLWETGILGFVFLLLLFWRFLSRTGRLARSHRGDQGWLFVGLTAAVFSYAVGMLTYDAFSFIQETFIFYLLLAIGAVVIRNPILKGRGVDVLATMPRLEMMSDTTRSPSPVSAGKVEHPGAPPTEVEPPSLEASPEVARSPSSAPPRLSAGEESARVSRSLDERRQALVEAEAAAESRRREFAEAEARLVPERVALAAAVAACDSREHALAQAEEALNRRTQALADNEADVDRRRHGLSEADAALETRQHALAEAEAGLDSHRQAVAAVEAALDERRRAIEAAEAAAESRRREFAEAEARLVPEREALAAAVAACDSREHALAQAEEALNRRTQALADNEADVDRRRHGLSEADAALETRQHALAEAEAGLDSHRQAVAAVEAALDERRRAIEAAEASVDARRHALAKAEAAANSDREALAGAAAELEGRRQAIAEADTALQQQLQTPAPVEVERDARRRALEETEAAVEARQHALAEAEAALDQRRHAIGEIEASFDSRRQELAEAEASLAARRQAVETAWESRGRALADAGKALESQRRALVDTERAFELRRRAGDAPSSGEGLSLIAELEERETALRKREEAIAAEEERLLGRAARVRLLEARDHEIEEAAQAAAGERTVELDRREHELLRRERALNLRVHTLERHVRDAWEAENAGRREEARLQAELEAPDERPSGGS